MLETLAFMTWGLALALVIGAALAVRPLRKALTELRLVGDVATGTLATLQRLADLEAAQALKLDEAIAQLPRRAKPGRKPSTSSTGAKRGRPPKSASTPAPAEPAEPAPPAAPPTLPQDNAPAKVRLPTAFLGLRGVGGDSE